MSQKQLEASYKRHFAAHQNTSVDALRTAPDAFVREISFDVTKARGFELFQTENPQQRVSEHYRTKAKDYKLSDRELQAFQTRGFIATSRLGDSSFGRLYYSLYNNDLPVYITGDSILHAWHHSFDRIMGTVEGNVFLAKLRSCFLAIDRAIKMERRRTEVFTDAVFESLSKWILIALTLCKLEQSPYAKKETEGEAAGPALPEDVAAIVAAIKQANGGPVVELFGNRVTLDYGDFLPRGRYTQSYELRSYFRVVKWISASIFRIASSNQTESSQCQSAVAGMLLLRHLINVSRTGQEWTTMTTFQEKLSGTPDGLSLRELNDILSKWNLNPSGDMLSLIKSQAVLRNIQESIVASRVGGELINSRVEQSENSDNKVDPQDYVFVLFGSSFGFDHWCSTKVTGKVGPADAPQRRTMSSVDTAFMALNSDVAGDVIADRISLMVKPKPIEKKEPFDGYASHPAVVPDSERGAVLGQIRCSAGFFKNKRSVVIEIRENDTVATVKRSLWPHCDAVLENKEPTPINMSFSEVKTYKDTIYLFGDTDANLFTKEVPKWREISLDNTLSNYELSFSNVFPRKSPDSFQLHDPVEVSRLRDGIPFQREALSARSALSDLPDAAWQGSIYSQWLACLRRFTVRPDNAELPQALRTKAFAYRMLSSKLSSWAELQHDFVLYMKRPVLRGGCSFPFGVAEPIPEFWHAFGEMVDLFGSIISPFDGDLVALKGHYVPVSSFLRTFRSALHGLEKIASKVVQSKPLSVAEENFIRTMMETLEYGSGTMKFEGWYPQMYWPTASGCVDQDDGLTCDVFTHMPDPQTGDVGGVVHAATRNIDFMMIALDRGDDIECFGGGLFQLHEFEASSRMTDNDWQQVVEEDVKACRPQWTKEYRV